MLGEGDKQEGGVPAGGCARAIVEPIQGVVMLLQGILQLPCALKLPSEAHALPLLLRHQKLYN